MTRGVDSSLPKPEEAMAVPVGPRVYPQLGHSISPEGVQAAREFLAAKLARSEAGGKEA